MIGFMTSQRMIIKFEINERVITYFDNIWKEGIQIMPSQTVKMKLMLRKMLQHRKLIVRQTALYIVDANSGDNLKEYEACKTEEEIADLVRRDCIKKQLTEIK